MPTASRIASLTAAFGAAAIALSLVLTGCGKSESPDQTKGETSQESDAQDATAKNGDFSQEIDSAASIVRTMAQAGDTTGANEFNALPQRETDELSDLAGVDALTEGEEDVDKDASGRRRLEGLGIQMSIPSSWQAGRQSDGSLAFISEDEGIIGILYGCEKPAGSHYDLENMVRAVPSRLAAQGYTDIQIISTDNGYSDHGTLCASYIYFTATIDGVEHAHYIQLVESKSYLNVIEIDGTTEGFSANLAQINEIIASVKFIADEVI